MFRAKVSAHVRTTSPRLAVYGDSYAFRNDFSQGYATPKESKVCDLMLML